VQSDYETQIADLEREKASQSLAVDREFMAQQDTMREMQEEKRYLENEIRNLQAKLEENELYAADMQQVVSCPFSYPGNGKQEARLNKEVDTYKARVSTLEQHLRKLNSSLMDLKRERYVSINTSLFNPSRKVTEQETEETKKLLEETEEERKKNEAMAKQLKLVYALIFTHSLSRQQIAIVKRTSQYAFQHQSCLLEQDDRERSSQRGLQRGLAIKEVTERNFGD
jgi:hypothetical protein